MKKSSPLIRVEGYAAELKPDNRYFNFNWMIWLAIARCNTSNVVSGSNDKDEFSKLLIRTRYDRVLA